eukprot:789715-Prorocentrum_lima.AAC.1
MSPLMGECKKRDTGTPNTHRPPSFTSLQWMREAIWPLERGKCFDVTPYETQLEVPVQISRIFGR